MGFFPDEVVHSEYIEIMVPVLPRSFYSDSEWNEILTRGISPQGECVEIIKKPQPTKFFRRLQEMKKGKQHVDK